METLEPVRDPKTGLCIQADWDEVGEAVNRIVPPLQRSHDYVGEGGVEATGKKLLRDVFKKGDLFWRLGDALSMVSCSSFHLSDLCVIPAFGLPRRALWPECVSTREQKFWICNRQSDGEQSLGWCFGKHASPPVCTILACAPLRCTLSEHDNQSLVSVQHFQYHSLVELEMCTEDTPNRSF